MKTRVIVTGGGSGIEFATCEALEAAGYEPMAFDTATADNVESLDVTDEGSWASIFDRMGGPIAGLVNCGRIRARRFIVDTELADFERHLRVNVTKTWLGIREPAPPRIRLECCRRQHCFGPRHHHRARPSALRRIQGGRRRAHQGGSDRRRATRCARQRNRARANPHADDQGMAGRSRTSRMARRPSVTEACWRGIRDGKRHRVLAVGYIVVHNRNSDLRRWRLGRQWSLT